jgi:hypothetical protein
MARNRAAAHLQSMTRDDIAAYYRDPEITWFDAGFGSNGGVNGGPLPEAGYYVIAQCGRPECCRPIGPFSTVAAARDWSCENGAEHA